MKRRKIFEKWYQKLHKQFVEHSAYQDLKKNPSRLLALDLVENVCKTHLRSPQILGFLYSVAPPSSLEHVKHNLLEELGEEGEESHPDLLRRLGDAVGFSKEKWQLIEASAEQVLKDKIDEPLMFGSLKEVGLNVLLETVGFEWFLSREASTMGRLFEKSLSLDDKDLEWFFHHSEVDIQHAEEGLDTLVDYVSYFGFDDDTVRNIGEITFRNNVFLKRYFDIEVESQLL